jgi:hypothetical protein
MAVARFQPVADMLLVDVSVRPVSGAVVWWRCWLVVECYWRFAHTAALCGTAWRCGVEAAGVFRAARCRPRVCRGGGQSIGQLALGSFLAPQGRISSRQRRADAGPTHPVEDVTVREVKQAPLLTRRSSSIRSTASSRPFVESYGRTSHDTPL